MNKEPAYDDTQQLRLIAAGDRQALAELYERYQHSLFSYLLQLTPDYGLAEELLQDTLVAIWKSAHSFEGRSSVQTWIFSIARRQAHNTLRQTELTNWETIKNTVHFAIASEPLPSTNVLDQVWSKIDAPSIEVHAQPKSIHHTFVHVWLVFTHQIRLIHKSIWIASTLVGLFCCSLAFIFSRQAQNHLQYVTSILVLFTAVVALPGIAFLHGTENDAGFEITLATPTSLRAVMLCRMVLVIGYNFVFAAMASFIIALVHGGGIWEIMQLWLGPMPEL